MTDNHIQKIIAWAKRTPEVRRIFAYVSSSRPETWPAKTVSLAIEVAPPQRGSLNPFSLWHFEHSRFWAELINATPSDFQFALDGYYPEFPEVIRAWSARANSSTALKPVH